MAIKPFCFIIFTVTLCQPCILKEPTIQSWASTVWHRPQETAVSLLFIDKLAWVFPNISLNREWRKMETRNNMHSIKNTHPNAIASGKILHNGLTISVANGLLILTTCLTSHLCYRHYTDVCCLLTCFDETAQKSHGQRKGHNDMSADFLPFQSFNFEGWKSAPCCPVPFLRPWFSSVSLHQNMNYQEARTSLSSLS